MGWWGVLPPLINDSQQWWLPLSDAALVELSAAVLKSTGDWDDLHPPAVARLADALQADPPLFLFAALSWPGEEFVTVTELAQWLIGTAPDLFSSGEWILAAPQFTADQERRWSRLMAQSRRLPPSRWMELASQWLQVIGPDVPSSWSATWPEVLFEQAESSSKAPAAKTVGSQLLQNIARIKKRELVTEDSLSELAEKRKMAAAKQLAYGLSHEINNPLANISARAQSLARDEIDPKRVQSLERIVQQVYRAHEMIAGLMFFANPSDPDPQSVDLNGLVDQAAADFGDSALENDIRLLTEKLDEPAMVRVDPVMMKEAVRALIRNSIEAIGAGGTVVVSLERQQTERNGARLLIHVADSGPGLTPQSAQHAFDPFYSGREAGRGLGLGLCRAYRVAKLHRATIRLSGGLAGCVATITMDAI